MALLIALNPLRLGLTLLLISRPRPIQNLFAYWLGNLASGIPLVVVPLALLHTTPMFESTAKGVAKSPIIHHLQIGGGIFALTMAALMTVRFSARRYHRAQLIRQPERGRHRKSRMSTLELDADAPTPIARLLNHARTGSREDASAVRRLLRRGHDAWENGSVWVAFVIGLANFPAPDAIFMVLAIIVASGTAIATQVSVAVAFIVGVLAVAELTLLSYLAAPAKTQAGLKRLHDWAWIHRRKILVAVATVGGASLVATGLGAI